MATEYYAFFKSLKSHVPPGQLGRFIAVGFFNTFAGYAVFAALNFLFSQIFPTYGFLIAALSASLINITVAFLGYKWIVFKTSGNYLREWLRTVSVYAVSIIVTFALLPIAVYVVQRLFDVSYVAATYLGGLPLTVLAAAWNFLANKNYSFRSKTVASDQ